MYTIKTKYGDNPWHWITDGLGVKKKYNKIDAMDIAKRLNRFFQVRIYKNDKIVVSEGDIAEW